ncbi:MAG: CAP domain-containing protein [Burkholderiales bacterium]|nr:CAP domain-containing protein [Burkholderiales bacterium]
MRWLPGLLAALAALAAASAATASPRAGAASPSTAAAGEVSRLRASAGLGPVVADPALARAADSHARAMRDARTMSHDIGGSFSARIAAAGIRTTQAAENIAAGQRSLAEAMASWTASSGHRANMLSRGVTRIGVGRADGAGGPFWAMILAAPEPPPRRAGDRPLGGGAVFFGLPIPLSP